MVWKIIQLLISIGLIIGGLSGELVLKGTNSSSLLVVFGFVWLIYDIYSIYAYKKAQAKIRESIEESIANESSKMESPGTVLLTRTSNILGCAMGVRVFLNGVEQAVLKNGKTLVMQTEFLQNTLVVISANNVIKSIRFEAIPRGNVNITFKYVDAKLILEENI
jgi:hypothetical protein